MSESIIKNQSITEKGSFAVTVANTGGENWILRNGSIRILEMRFIGLTLAAKSTTKVGDIAVGDRPKYYMRGQGYALDSSGYPIHNVMINIGENGEINVLNGNATAYGIIAVVPYMV